MKLLTPDNFPKLSHMKRGTWAPVLLKPARGSPERLVVAVVAYCESDFHVAPANQISRLECLYGKDIDLLSFSVESALKYLEHRIAENPEGALESGDMLYSNIEIGHMNHGEASSMKALAETWVSSLSSLHAPPSILPEQTRASRSLTSADSVPEDVYEKLTTDAPHLTAYFSDFIRNGSRRRSGRAVSGLNIDFRAPKLFASFEGLHTTSRAASIDRIKRKMFDLIVAQDKGANDNGRFEMLVHAPLLSSTHTSKRQLKSLSDAIDELNYQVSDEDIDFQAFGDMNALVNHVKTQAA